VRAVTRSITWPTPDHFIGLYPFRCFAQIASLHPGRSFAVQEPHDPGQFRRQRHARQSFPVIAVDQASGKLHMRDPQTQNRHNPGMTD
jgi:hypothetical protein